MLFHFIKRVNLDIKKNTMEKILFDFERKVLLFAFLYISKAIGFEYQSCNSISAFELRVVLLSTLHYRKKSQSGWVRSSTSSYRSLPSTTPSTTWPTSFSTAPFTAGMFSPGAWCWTLPSFANEKAYRCSTRSGLGWSCWAWSRSWGISCSSSSLNARSWEKSRKRAGLMSRSLIYELFEEDLRECLDKRSNVLMEGGDER